MIRMKFKDKDAVFHVKNRLICSARSRTNTQLNSLEFKLESGNTLVMNVVTYDFARALADKIGAKYSVSYE